MGWYYLTLFALSALALDLAAEGAPEIGIGFFILTVAYEWAVGRQRRSWGVCVMAAITGLLATESLAGAAVYACSVQLGVGMGMAFRRHWTFGACVASITAAVYGVALYGMVSQWSVTRSQLTIAVNSMIARIEEVGRQGGGLNELRVEQLKWIDLNWAYVGPGLLFGFVLMGTTAAVAFLSVMVRRAQVTSLPATRFRRMRTSEWLVWPAILVALLWFVDRRWPHEALRVLTWNSAMALTFVYALNGLSIIVYAMGAFQLGTAMAAIIAVVVFLSGAQTLVPLGLFDTWWDFRRVVDRLIQMRRMKGSSGPTDA